jgi:general secretion pathway protein M
MNTGTRMALPAHWTAHGAALRARWRALSQRDRGLARLMLLVLAAFLLWVVAIQPAWRTLRDAPARIEALEVQTQTMRAQASEARDLRAAPALSVAASTQALKAASDRLGKSGRLSLQGDRAVLTLTGASSEQLREWLAEARSGARARPVEAQLSRNAQGYSGTVVLSLGGAAP